ncbi:MAG: CvpA family protein [Planctomycetes bacterium]|nr:CvpA family protein [Planctomycetota bacterium]
MIVLITVIVIMVASATFFYLKSSLLTSIAMLFAAIIAVLVSFNFYELLAYQLVSRGHGGQWAHPGCLVLLFIVTFVLIRVGSDQLVGANIDLGYMPKAIVSTTCGLAVGFILAGVVVVALAMAPLSPSVPYERFTVSGKLSAARVSSSKSVIVDSFVSGLFKLASKGSFSSKKSFDVYHPDFLDQLHLNRKGLGDDKKTGVPMIADEEAIIVPSRNAVRTNENFTIVRAGIKGGSIEKGGSSLGGSSVSFTPGQLRLLCKKGANDTKGSAKAFYPVKYQLLDGPMGESDEEDAGLNLNEVVNIDSKSLTKRTGGRAAWMDIYYEVKGSGYQAIFLQFRNNAIAKLSKPVVETPEILQDLDK